MNRLSENDFYLNEVSGSDEVPELPTTQSQHFWVEALRDNGHQVTVERYTDSQLVSPQRRAAFDRKLKGLTSLGFAAYRKGSRSIPQRLNPEIRARNERIVSNAIAADPELVLITGGYTQLFPHTIERIKAVTGATIAGTCGVGPFDYSNACEREIAVKYYDFAFTNTSHRTQAWRALGVNAVQLPVSGCAPAFAKAVKETDERFTADVSFVGQPYPRRVMYFEQLPDVDVALYGPGWDETPLAEYHRGEAWGKERIKAIYNSKISLNVHHRCSGYGGNMRLFEIPVAGTMQIVDTYDPDWYEEGDEIVSVETPEEMRDTVEYYLNNDEKRNRIAEQGHERAKRDHNYHQRMEQLVSIVANDGGVPDGVVDTKYIEKYAATPHWSDPVK